MSFDPNAIGNRIFTLRTNAKLSQEKLAEKTWCFPSTPRRS